MNSSGDEVKAFRKSLEMEEMEIQREHDDNVFEFENHFYFPNTSPLLQYSFPSNLLQHTEIIDI